MSRLAVTLGVPVRRSTMMAALAGLVAVNLDQMRRNAAAGHPLPPLYTTRVRYRREPRGSEAWRSAVQVLRDGYGDCEDLSAYRTAELIFAGQRAVVDVARTARRTWHARVRRADGAIEDPSRYLKWKENRTRR